MSDDSANDAREPLDLPKFYVTGPGNAVRMGSEGMVYDAAAKAAQKAIGGDLDGRDPSELTDEELLSQGLRDLAVRVARQRGDLADGNTFGIRLLGVNHENPTFMMRRWRKPPQTDARGSIEVTPPNFTYDGLEIRWRASIGREMVANRPLVRAEIEAMLKACVDSLGETA